VRLRQFDLGFKYVPDDLQRAENRHRNHRLSKVDASVGHDDITTLAKGRDNRC